MVWRWPRQLGRFRRPTSGGRRDVTELADPFASAQAASERESAEQVETPFLRLLSEIEGSACAVFARHGLPDRPGHYAYSPTADSWRFLAEDLTAEERWSLVNAQRAGSGWRFGTLEDLGDQPGNPAEVRHAAEMLRACRLLRVRLDQGGGAALAEALEAALGLGVRWRAVSEPRGETPVPPAPVTPPPHSEPLRLSVPAKPRASRRKPRANP